MRTARPCLPWLLVPLAMACSEGEGPPTDPGVHGAESEGEPEPPPPLPRGLITNTGEAAPGYTLIAPLMSFDTHLVDAEGEVVHTWRTDCQARCSAYLMDDGSLLRCGEELHNPVFHGGGAGGHVQRISWDGEVVWDYTYSDAEKRHHHDIEPLPNGNVLVISWVHRTVDEAIAAGRNPELLDQEGLWPCEVVEIEPALPDGGDVVWRWNAWDHLVQDFDRSRENYGDPAAHPELLDVNLAKLPPPDEESDEERREREEREAEMAALGYGGGGDEEEETEISYFPRFADWLHVNSVEYVEEYDLIVLSSNHLSEVFAIDHSTTTEEAAGHDGGRWGHGGDLLWRWGNPRNYRAGDESDQKLFAQHHATWLAGDRLLIFNNGEGRLDGEYSSIEELELPFDPETGFAAADGGALGPAEAAWSYVAPERESFYGSFISGVQRIPGGHTLVCSGPQGRVFELDGDDAIVWEFNHSFGGEDRVERPEKPWFKPAEDGDAMQGIADLFPHATFRAERIPFDHPALAGRDLDAR